jgi:hypothetical protein
LRPQRRKRTGEPHKDKDRTTGMVKGTGTTTTEDHEFISAIRAVRRDTLLGSVQQRVMWLSRVMSVNEMVRSQTTTQTDEGLPRRPRDGPANSDRPE